MTESTIRAGAPGLLLAALPLTLICAFLAPTAGSAQSRETHPSFASLDLRNGKRPIDWTRPALAIDALNAAALQAPFEPDCSPPGAREVSAPEAPDAPASDWELLSNVIVIASVGFDRIAQASRRYSEAIRQANPGKMLAPQSLVDPQSVARHREVLEDKLEVLAQVMAQWDLSMSTIRQGLAGMISSERQRRCLLDGYTEDIEHCRAALAEYGFNQRALLGAMLELLEFASANRFSFEPLGNGLRFAVDRDRVRYRELMRQIVELAQQESHFEAKIGEGADRAANRLRDFARSLH